LLRAKALAMTGKNHPAVQGTASPPREGNWWQKFPSCGGVAFATQMSGWLDCHAKSKILLAMTEKNKICLAVFITASPH